MFIVYAMFKVFSKGVHRGGQCHCSLDLKSWGYSPPPEILEFSKVSNLKPKSEENKKK